MKFLVIFQKAKVFCISYYRWSIYTQAHSVVWPRISTKAASKTRKLYSKARLLVLKKKKNKPQQTIWEQDKPEAFYICTKSYIYLVSNCFMVDNKLCHRLLASQLCMNMHRHCILQVKCCKPSHLLCFVLGQWARGGQVTQPSAPSNAQANATCRRESDEGEEGRLEERRLRESSHWSTKNRRDGSVSG